MIMASRERPKTGRRGGFTLIELMVVVAIVIMAMGIMAPTLLEFFKNQKLKNVRSHFSSAFNVGRLMAVSEGTAVRVVFFKEGVRVYNVRNKMFRRDEDFNPEAAPGSISGISFKLRFARLTNSDLQEYRTWEKDQPHLNQLVGSDPQAGQCNVDGLVAIEFQRDGTVKWLQGSDIPSSEYKKDPPDADIVVEQIGNPEGLFVDVRNTGPIQTKLALLPEVPVAK